jgi:hypothetical protein
MSLITREKLMWLADKPRFDREIAREPAIPSLCDIAVYLSYRRGDAELAEGVRELFLEQGISVSSAVMNGGYPAKFDAVVADQMRREIGERTVLVPLISRECLLSMWLPWQLGLLEGMDRAGEVILVALDEMKDSAEVQAYQSRYPDLCFGNSMAAAVRSPAGYLTSLTAWMAQRQRRFLEVNARSLAPIRADWEIHPFHRSGCAGL